MRTKVLNFVKNNREKGLLLADQALVSGINFLVGIVLARLLGVENFGMFSLAWMVLFFASGLQQAFLTAPLFALTAKQNDPSTWFAQLLSVQLVLSAACIVLIPASLYVLSAFQPEWNLTEFAPSLALLIAVFLFNDFNRRLLFVQKRSASVFKLDLLGYGLQPVIIGVLFFLNLLTVKTALSAILIAQSFSLVFILLVIRPNFKLKGFFITLKKLWKYSRFLVATALLQWSSANYIILFAASILGPAALGAIRVSQNLMGVLNVLFQAMENSIPARSAEAYHQGGLAELGSYIQKVTKQLIAPVALFLGVIALFHQQIMVLIYGEAYLPYSSILLAFCGIYVFVFLGTLLRFVIRTLEHNQLIFISYVFTTLFSLLAGKALATYFGLSGVMLGIASTQLISFFTFITFLKIKVKWNFKLSM